MFKCEKNCKLVRGEGGTGTGSQTVLNKKGVNNKLCNLVHFKAIEF